jgi:hypothetical protein
MTSPSEADPREGAPHPWLYFMLPPRQVSGTAGPGAFRP